MNYFINLKLLYCLAFTIMLSAITGKANAQCGSASSYQPTSSATTVCSQNYVYLYATGLPVSTWVYRDNNTGNWINLFSSSDNISQYINVTVPTIRTYRAIVSIPGCPADSTQGVSVTLTPPNYGVNNDIALSTTAYNVCSGSSVTLKMMNSGYAVSAWLYRDNGGSWFTYTLSNSQSINVGMPNTSTPLVREFRTLAKVPKSCQVDSSAIISINVMPPVPGNNGNIRPSLTQQSICGGTGINVQVTWPLDIGNWLYKDDNSSEWTSFTSGSTNAFDNNTNVAASTTRSYRVVLKDANTCSFDTSDAATIHINASGRRTLTSIQPRFNSTNPIDFVCAGNSITFNLQGYSIQNWIYKDSVNGVWNTFGGSSNSPSLSSQNNLTKDLNRTVRAIINNSSNTCTIDTSAELTYTVKAIVRGNTTSAIPFTNNHEYSAGAQITAYMQTNLPNSQWIYRDNNTGSWISGSSGNTYTNSNTNVITNTQRAFRVVIQNTANCRYDTTPQIQVLIKVPEPGSTIDLTPSINSTTVCSGSIINGSTALGTGLQALKWIYRDNNTGIWNDLQNQTSTSFNDNTTGDINTTTTRSYRLIVRNLEKITLDTTQEASVMINPPLRGNYPTAPTSASSPLCNGTSATISLVLPTGYTIQRWIYRDLTTQPWTQYGSTSTNISLQINTTAPSRTFRAILQNTANCHFDTTSEVTISVNQRTQKSNPSLAPIITSNNAICSGTSISMNIPSASGVSVLKWMRRDNANAWSDISSSSFSYTESSTNTRVLIPVTRDYRVVVSDNNTCSIDTSAFSSVTISPLQNGATSNITPTVSSGPICSGTNFSVSINTGSVQKWVYRDNEGDWTEFQQSTSSISLFEQNSHVAVPTTREYRAYLTRSGTCFIDTTQSASVLLKPLMYGSANALQTIASLANVCSGGSVNFSITSSPSYAVQKWVFRDNNTGPWRDALNATTSTSYNESNTNVISQTARTYRTIILTNTCSYDTSAPATVLINPRQNGYAAATTIQSSQAIFCSASTINANVVSSTMPSSSFVSKWLYRDNQTGPWLEIANSQGNTLSHSNTFVSSPTTRSYRVLINNGNTCSFDSSSVYSVSINPNTHGYITSVTPTTNNNFICAGSTHPTLNISNFSGNVMKWLVNDDNSGWRDFGYATANANVTDYNVNVNAPTNRSYRAIINNTTTCSFDSSNIASISINPYTRTTLNTVIPTSSRATICYSKPTVISIGNQSGYSVNKWLYNDNNTGWVDFNNSTGSSTLTDNNTFVASNTGRAYRAILMNTGLCRIDSSASYTMLISARGSSIGNNTIQPTTSTANICSGSNVNVSVSPPTGNETFRWIYSDNGPNGPWASAYNSYNTNTLQHTLTRTSDVIARLYRAILTDTTSCDFDTSLAVTVNIRPYTYGIDSSIIISGTSSDSVCMGSTISLNINPGSGNSTFKWLYNENFGPWKNFSMSTNSNTRNDAETFYAPGNIKGYTALVLKTSACRYDTLTKARNIVIKSKTYGTSATYSAVINMADTVCPGQNAALLTSPSGQAEKWLYSDGGTTNWQEIPGSSGFSFNHPLNVTSSTWRYYRAIISTGSCNGDSSKIDSVYIRVQTAGYFAASPTTTNTSVCAGNQINLNFNASNPGTIQRWMYRDNSGIWNTLNVTTSTSVTDYNTSVSSPITREYRVITFRNCSYDTSNSVSVSITPKVYSTDITKTPTATSTTVCAGSSVTNISVSAGSGNSIIRWLYKDNNGEWRILSNTNANGITDNNTYIGSTVTRSYVALINNNTNCRFDTTAPLVVTINPVVLGNSSRTVTAPATACMGSSYNVQLNVSGDSSAIRFFYNTNGGPWIDRGYITPTTSANINEYAYNSGSSYVMGYRGVTYKAGNCHIDTTAPAYVTINQRTYGNDNAIIPSSSLSSYCSGTSINVSVSPGSGNSVQYWIYSDNNGDSWNTVYSSNNNISQSLYATNTITRQYRALIVKGSSCTIDTTAPRTVTINPLVYATDNTVATTVSGNPGVCTGSQVTVSVNPGSAAINNWLYRDNYTGNWINMYSSSNSITDYNTNTSTLINRQYAVVLYKSASCHMDTTTLNDTAHISPRSFGNDNSISVTSSQGANVCTGTAISMNVANLSGNTVESWIYRVNGGAWLPFYNGSTTSMGDYNTHVTSASAREYRVIVRKSSACSFDTSASYSTTINPRSVGTDNGIVPTVANGNVCSGSPVSISISSGSGNTVQKWLFREGTSGSWSDFAYTSATTVNDYNTVTSSPVTRQYRAIVQKASGCAIDTSNFVTAVINPIGYGNQNSVIPSANSSNICSGSYVTLNVSGFSGSSVLRWLTRDDMNDSWTELNSSSVTIADYNTYTTTAFGRQYRALVVNASGCSYDTTGIRTININPITNGIAAASASVSQSTICTGSPANVFINTPSGYAINDWLYKDPNTSWTSLNAGYSASVNDFNTTVSANTQRQYRAILRNTAGCNFDSSGIATVNINLITAGTNLAVIPNSTTPVICANSTATVSVSGFSGSVVKWLYRDSSVYGWSSINNSNFTLFDANTFVSYPRTREYRAIIYNANNCSNDTTASVQITINPQLQGNAYAIAPTTTTSAICSGSPITAHVTGFINGGSVTAWVYSDNGNAWISIPSSAGTTITHHNTTVTLSTTRQYRALVLTGCITDTTAPLTITIDLQPDKPVISNPAGTDSLICSVTGATYKWRRNGDLISGANDRHFIPTQSGSYTVEVETAGGCQTTSDAFIYNRTGMSEVELNALVSLYPNPTTTGQVTVDLSHSNIETVNVTVMDLLGKIVYENIDQTNTRQIQIDLSGNHAGIYFVTIRAEGASITKRIVYNK